MRTGLTDVATQGRIKTRQLLSTPTQPLLTHWPFANDFQPLHESVASRRIWLLSRLREPGEGCVIPTPRVIWEDCIAVWTKLYRQSAEAGMRSTACKDLRSDLAHRSLH